MIQAIIFDLNGTVLDDEAVYGRAFQKVLSDLGSPVDYDPHILGIGATENWPILVNKFDIKTSKTAEELAVETNNEYLRVFDREVKLMKGFVEFIKDVHLSGISTGLATSNSWKIVEKTFDKFDIAKYFDCVTTGEEVARKKPSPEIYLLTADKLGIDYRSCLVIEDADSGIEAARLADMKVIAIDNENPNADLNVSDFTELTPKKLASTLKTRKQEDANFSTSKE